MIGILLCRDKLYVAVEKLCVHIVLVAKASRMSSIVHLVHVCHLRFSGDQFEEEFRKVRWRRRLMILMECQWGVVHPMKAVLWKWIYLWGGGGGGEDHEEESQQAEEEDDESLLESPYCRNCHRGTIQDEHEDPILSGASTTIRMYWILSLQNVLITDIKSFRIKFCHIRKAEVQHLAAISLCWQCKHLLCGSKENRSNPVYCWPGFMSSLFHNEQLRAIHAEYVWQFFHIDGGNGGLITSIPLKNATTLHFIFHVRSSPI